MKHKVTIQDIRTVWEKAYTALLTKYNPQTRDEAYKLWIKEYHSQINYNPGWGNWETIEFENENEFLLFCLRWA